MLGTGQSPLITFVSGQDSRFCVSGFCPGYRRYLVWSESLNTVVIADAHRILLGVEQCVMSICSWNLLLEFIRLSCQQDSEEQDREQEHVDSESG